MLYITFNRPELLIHPGSSYFDHSPTIPDNVILTEFSRRVIKTIDKSEVIDVNCILSPVLGGIPPKQLSGGTKNLLTLMYNEEDIPVNITGFGENCFQFFQEISEARDITLYMSIITCLFGNAGNLKQAVVKETGKIVTSDSEFFSIYPFDTKNYVYT